MTEGGRVLLVDDNEQHLAMLAQTLRVRGYEVIVTMAPETVEELYGASQPDVVVVDLTMPVVDGLELLARLRHLDPAAGILLLSAFMDVPTTVKALRLGADDVLTKPVQLPLLLASITRTAERVQTVRLQRAAMMQSADAAMYLDGSPLMHRCYRALQQAALGVYTLLFRGESGTGKSAAAELVHRLSPRGDGPFVRVACGQMSSEQLARELFSQSDAESGPKTRRDLFEAAEGGTLFLDDVGSFPLDLQPRLLAAIERHTPGAVGVPGGLRSGVRIVSASSMPLEELVDRGAFRVDLHLTVAAVPITIPALRARGAAAIASLATQLLKLHQVRIGRGPTRFSAEALTLLGAYRWPGNVRELRLVIRHSFPYALDAAELDVTHLPPELQGVDSDEAAATETVAQLDASRTLDAIERRHIARVLSEVGGNRSLAAKILGISRGTLYNKISAYGFEQIARD